MKLDWKLISDQKPIYGVPVLVCFGCSSWSCEILSLEIDEETNENIWVDSEYRTYFSSPNNYWTYFDLPKGEETE